MFQYVTLGLAAFAGVIVLFNIIKALIRGLKKSVGSLIAIVLSAIIAGVVTFIVCKPDSALMVAMIDALKEIFTEGTINDILSIEELGVTVAHYSSMLVAPLFFAVAYVIISLIVSIIVAIIVKKVLPNARPGKVANRLGGAGVGLVCGFLVTVILLAPIVGTISLVSAVNETMNEVEVDDEIATVVNDAANSKLVNAFLKAGCGFTYDTFASTKLDGERIYLREEVEALAAILNGVIDLGVPMEEYGQDQIHALDVIVDGISGSPLLESTVAGVLSEAANTWLAGEDFLGAEKPEVDGIIAPVVDGILVIMATSDKDNISADLRTIRDILAVLIRNKLLDPNVEAESILTKIGENGVIEDLLVAIATNPHMAPLADEITNLSVRALATAIGIPESAGERYDDLMGDIAAMLNESYGMDETARDNFLERSLKNVFDGYGVAMEAEELSSLVDGLVADLGNASYVEASDVEEFFIVYAAAKAKADGEAKGRAYSFDMLSAGSETPKITVNGDGTISVGERVLENYTAATYLNTEAYKMGMSKVELGGAATLYSAETMVSSIITLDDIMSVIGKYSDCENVEEEIAKIAGIFKEAAAILSEIDITTADPGELLSKLGGLLDGMKDSKIFGVDTAKNILSAVLQSDAIASGLGLSKSEMTFFSEKMSDMANSMSAAGYADAAQAVTSTLGALNSITDGAKTEEEKKQATEELINNITTESAEMVSSMVTSSLVENMGVPTENTESISSALTSMLNNMASFKEGEQGSNTDAVSSEAEAVNTLLDMAMNLTSGSIDQTFFSDDENEGVLGTTADEFIDIVVNSEVVSSTLIETVYTNGYTDNPLGIPELGEAEAEYVSGLLQSYFENNGGGADLAEKLGAIASIINVEFGEN